VKADGPLEYQRSDQYESQTSLARWHELSSLNRMRGQRGADGGYEAGASWLVDRLWSANSDRLSNSWALAAIARGATACRLRGREQAAEMLEVPAMRSGVIGRRAPALDAARDATSLMEQSISGSFL
jgi:hypothetical protein